MYEIGKTYVFGDLKDSGVIGKVTKIYCVNKGDSQEFYLEIECHEGQRALIKWDRQDEEKLFKSKNVKELPQYPILGSAM